MLQKCVLGEESCEELIIWFINNRFNLDQTGSWGDTPLTYAIFRNRIKIIQLLIQAGADVNKKGGEGKSPLQWAKGILSDDLIELMK